MPQLDYRAAKVQHVPVWYRYKKNILPCAPTQSPPTFPHHDIVCIPSAQEPELEQASPI